MEKLCKRWCICRSNDKNCVFGGEWCKIMVYMIQPWWPSSLNHYTISIVILVMLKVEGLNPGVCVCDHNLIIAFVCVWAQDKSNNFKF